MEGNIPVVYSHRLNSNLSRLQTYGVFLDAKIFWKRTVMDLHPLVVEVEVVAVVGEAEVVEVVEAVVDMLGYLERVALGAVVDILVGFLA